MPGWLNVGAIVFVVGGARGEDFIIRFEDVLLLSA